MASAGHSLSAPYRRVAVPTSGSRAPPPLTDALASSCVAGLDHDGQIYEDIDRSSVGSAAGAEGDGAVDSGVFSSSRRATVADGGRAASSGDDSWGSGEFESFSSDGDDDDADKIHSPV